jgi:hypothetical protein
MTIIIRLSNTDTVEQLSIERNDTYRYIPCWSQIIKTKMIRTFILEEEM